MTMPSERTRSLRWGHEVLQEIAKDSSIDEGFRNAATELLRAYPSPGLVRQWIDADINGIAIDSAESIERAGILFKEISRSGNCPAELINSLTFTLRHFPEQGDAKRWTALRGHWTIREWLLPENFYSK